MKFKLFYNLNLMGSNLGCYFAFEDGKNKKGLYIDQYKKQVYWGCDNNYTIVDIEYNVYSNFINYVLKQDRNFVYILVQKNVKLEKDPKAIYWKITFPYTNDIITVMIKNN